MLNNAKTFGIWTFVVWLFAATVAIAQPAREQVVDAKQLWQLLDYVAVDYPGAVDGGNVVSEAEYAEMLDFTENASKLLISTQK